MLLYDECDQGRERIIELLRVLKGGGKLTLKHTNNRIQ